MPGEWPAIEQIVVAAALAGLQRATAAVEESAKAKAPVRHIFASAGSTRIVRAKRRSEVVADRELRRVLGLGPEYIRAPRKTPSRARRHVGTVAVGGDTANSWPWSGRLRTVIPRTRQLSPVAMSLLHRRGRYEVKSQRALWEGRIGGRLRDEITSVPVTGGGTHFESMVISPTQYAKYMEFGTSHNAAHPYLRPALRENRKTLRGLVKEEVRGAVRRTKLQMRGRA